MTSVGRSIVANSGHKMMPGSIRVMQGQDLRVRHAEEVLLEAAECVAP